MRSSHVLIASPTVALGRPGARLSAPATLPSRPTIDARFGEEHSP
jgi:hypothetical protein